jgi:hypothetical protein
MSLVAHLLGLSGESLGIFPQAGLAVILAATDLATGST